jgi:hypothetical protein
VFEKRVQRRIFEPKREEVTGKWRKLYAEFDNLHSFPTIIRVIKSRWMKHVACMEEMRMQTKLQSENMKETDLLGDLGTNGDKTKMDLKKLYMRVYTGFIWFKMGSSGGLL